MALITQITEIKEVLPKLVSNLNATSLLPNFNAAEEKYLVPLIGDALYADLQTKYTGNTLSPAELILIKHIRLLTASYALMDEQAATHVFITDDGIRVAGTTDMQKAVGWEYKELKKYLKDRALDATEVLLKYLWKNKATLDLWTASDAYKQFESLLIRTGTDFSEHYMLYQPMRTFYAFKTILNDVQDEYVSSALGKDLLNYLKDVAAPSPEEKSIIRKLKKGLAFYTIYRAGEHFPVRFSDAGFTVVADGGDSEGETAGSVNATLQMIEIKMKACKREGQNFMARAKNELVKLRTATVAANAFTTAFDTGPLTKYISPEQQTSGNEKRKTFRF